MPWSSDSHPSSSAPPTRCVLKTEKSQSQSGRGYYSSEHAEPSGYSRSETPGRGGQSETEPHSTSYASNFYREPEPPLPEPSVSAQSQTAGSAYGDTEIGTEIGDNVVVCPPPSPRPGGARARRVTVG